MVHHKFVHNRKQDEEEHAWLGKFDLVPYYGTGRSRSAHLLEDFIADGMNIAEVMERTRHSIIEKKCPNEISNIAKNVMRDFQRTSPENDFLNSSWWHEKAIDVGVEIATRAIQRLVL